jgi:hydrogenase-4 component F
MILNGAFAAGHFLIGAAFLFLLLVIFLGMGRTVLAAVLGRAPVAAARNNYRDGLLSGLPALGALLMVLLLGLYLPPPLRDLLHQASRYLGAKP